MSSGSWVNSPVSPQFYIVLNICLYFSQKRQNRDAINWLSAWVCSYYVPKILVYLSLNIFLKNVLMKNECSFFFNIFLFVFNNTYVLFFLFEGFHFL